MLLKNTSSHPTDQVRAIVQFAAGLIYIGNIAINVKGSASTFRGRAYRTVPWRSIWHPRRRRGQRQARYLIVCAVASSDRFPCFRPAKGPYFEWHLADWQEALVHLVAHELMHVQQYRADARASEEECERYALQRLEAWHSMKMREAA